MFVDAIDIWFTKYFHFLFVSWQPCNHFNVTFKVLPTNVTNVSPLPTTKLKHVIFRFVSLSQQILSTFFVKPFLAFIAVLKWFLLHLYQSVAPTTFSTFLKVRHESFFDLKKNRLWTRLAFSDTGVPVEGWG